MDVVHQPDKERGITVEDCKLIKFHMSNCNVFLIMVSQMGFVKMIENCVKKIL